MRMALLVFRLMLQMLDMNSDRSILWCYSIPVKAFAICSWEHSLYSTLVAIARLELEQV